jgi:hypothetical protein
MRGGNTSVEQAAERQTMLAVSSQIQIFSDPRKTKPCKGRSAFEQTQEKRTAAAVLFLAMPEDYSE